MQTSSEKPDPKSLQICQGDKFLSKLISPDRSVSNRVFYTGVSNSVLFNWETQPGTPRKLAVSSLDKPLTPPPPGYCDTNQTGLQMSSTNVKRSSKDYLGYESSKRGNSLTMESLSLSSSSSFSGRRSTTRTRRSSSYTYTGSSLISTDEKAVVDAEEEMVVSCKCSIWSSPISVTCFGSKKWSRGRKGGVLEIETKE